MKIHNELEQGSDEWHLFRMDKPTGSNAKKIITSKGVKSTQLKKYAISLAVCSYSGIKREDFKATKAMERGIELEPEARKVYDFVKETETEQVGFITDDLERYGVSPDGLLDHDGMVEFKCQEDEGHTTTLIYYAKNGRLPTDHFAQVQMQMFVAEREWCDTAHYHPYLPFKIVRSYPDPIFVKQLQIQLANVLEERDKIIKVLQDA